MEYISSYDLPFIMEPYTSSEPMDTTIFPREYNPQMIYSRELRKTRMEDLDNGLGRLVSSKLHLPRGPLKYTDTVARNQSIHEEHMARLHKDVEPKRQNCQRTCPGPSHRNMPSSKSQGAKRVEDDRLPSSLSDDVEAPTYFEPAYMQYPGLEYIEPHAEPLPVLAYLMFEDPAPEIRQQPYLGVPPAVDPWDVQMKLGPPTFRGNPIPVSHSSGMPGASNVTTESPAKKLASPTKKGRGVRKVKSNISVSKASNSEKKAASRRKKTT